MVVGGSTAVGSPLRAAANRAIVAAGRPVTRTIYSPYFRRLTVESYEPIPGQDIGILVQQARSEVMGPADELKALVRWVALGLGVAGATLAVFLGVFLGRRSRRLVLSEASLASSREDARRRLEEFLESEARLATIVRASYDAILAKTLDGIVTSWNPGAERLFGYTEAEMIGRSIDLLIPLEARDAEADIRRRAAQGTAVEEYETVRLRKHGGPVEVSTTLSPIRDGDGRVVGIAVVCRDVTDRKRAEAVLRAREAELAAARDEAVEASRLKSQFLSNTSHEIRTPITVILGMNELLLDTELDPTQRRFAEGVDRAGAGLKTIIEGILNFSRIEAGHVELAIAEVELRLLVDEVMALMAGAAQARGLPLTGSCGPEVPDVLQGDATRLRQVLLNLTANALKFTDQGGVEVRVLASAGPTGPVVRFEVVDTGIGIAVEDQASVFQPFSQVDGSDTRRHGGTGLGLAISAQLVGAMGGHIGVSSTLGAGSTFWFEVPVGGNGLDRALRASTLGGPATKG